MCVAPHMVLYIVHFMIVHPTPSFPKARVINASNLLV